MKTMGGRIRSVRAGSPAARAGLLAGDVIVAVDGHPVRDVLEFAYFASEERPRIRVLRGGRARSFRLERREQEDPGIELEEELFDGLRCCGNRCVFCFVRQMPGGMRGTLYQRDDDYRLSFAHGNYITLTNLGEEDLRRIREQRISPLYISVHTTEPELRERMMGSRRARRAMEQLRALAGSRITLHCQIVLVPGVNDGAHLERTVRDLASLHPAVASIAIVPVGLTRHREGLPQLRSVDAAGARAVLSACRAWQREFSQLLGTRLVFASDEFYLLARRPFPRRAAYEGFPQLADGVGVSRLFLDELAALSRRRDRLSAPPGRYVLITGTLSAPLIGRLSELLASLPGVESRVCVVENRFFGETVTVTGLLTGADVLSSLSGAEEDEVIVIPDIVLNEGRFLDDMTVEELAARVKGAVTVAPSAPRGLLECLSKRNPPRPRAGEGRGEGACANGRSES